ncbi:protein phosphatase [Sulfuriferula plumbiphila]|uniref:Protein phosphatase n=1 Tax=Sulfuriferula plumbiphila TaxID=171865 RepID=A0A512LAF8_9PROT|nr:Stp1/IreP family PP2C-type Ser/Thr phosphatase [Sulfuriferula plumbiphila]BBP04969.1 protein phosphatase [Sulfuriferula plumbiphila]GEP31464.1 protein phosphatase [Sulfuriferula plumbiphila]
MTARSHFHLEVASATDAGAIRSFNEDSIAADSNLGLLVLADGMGGYKAGDVASSIATGLVMDYLKRMLNEMAPSPIQSARLSPESMAVKSTIEKTNLAIYKTAQTDNKYTGMGTTIVLILFHHGLATIAHVGDSRLYRLRQGRLELLTHDHSLLQEQVEMGLISSEDAKVSHNRNLVSRALGVEAEIKVDVSEHNVQPNDIYLLCSDGLNDMVDDADIELAVSELRANLPLAASQLVQMANDNGGHDNVSVLIAKVRNGGTGEHHLMDRLFDWLKSSRINTLWRN